MEINYEQYDKLNLFGGESLRENDEYFDLYYNGATNSCIDFTFQALRFAGLLPVETWNDLSDYNKEKKKSGEFDGDLKVINNIPHIKSIPAPFPDSELNREHYNKIPERTLIQWLLSKTDGDEPAETV